MNKKQEEYLKSIGLITEKDKNRPEHLVIALEILAKTGVQNKSHNRFTGSKDTLASMLAERTGKTRGYTTREMAFWLDRFKHYYDKSNSLFLNICPPKFLDILTPWQLLYLVSLEYQKIKGE